MSLIFLKTRRFLKTDTFGLKADSHLHKLRFIGIFYKYESVDQISTKDVISCSKRRNTFATR